MTTIKNIFRSKTMWFSLALAVFGVLEASTSYLQAMIGPEHFGFVVIGIGIITAVLRILTTLPLDEK